jgi:hypothetical protein
MRARRALRLLLAVAALTSSLTVAGPVSADDGEIIETTGSNVAGEVYMDGGRPRFNFSNVGNCPGTMPAGASCYVEVRFTWRCTEAWCLSDERSGWYRVPSGQDWFRAPICADGYNRWHVDSRLHWTYPTIHTVEFWGEGEFNAALNAYFLIAKTIFDVSLNAGTRISGGTRMNRITASNAVSTYGRIASSFGALAGPNAC